MFHKTINVIDVEMECWADKSPGRIIQIGICQIDIQKVEIIKGDHFYINNRDISDYCTKLTGITQMMSNAGHPENMVKSILLEKYNLKKSMWASWGTQDVKCLKKYDWPSNGNHIDVRRIFPLFFGNDPKSLTKSLNDIGLEFEGRPHCAMWDAYNTSKIIIEILKR